MPSAARKALARVCAQPGDAAVGRALQRTMARWGSPAALHHDRHTVAADALLNVWSGDCDVVAIGDHAGHRITTDLGDLVVRVDVVALRAASRDFAVAFGQRLAAPDDDVAGRGLAAAARRAVLDERDGRETARHKTTTDRDLCGGRRRPVSRLAVRLARGPEPPAPVMLA